MLTFKEWIVKFSGVDLPIGDLARDIERDKRFPNSIIYEDIVSYLEYDANASQSVMYNFERVYKFYLESMVITFQVN